MFDNGLFGDLFDFDGDGKLNSFERTADFGLFCQIMDDMEREEEEKEEDDE